MKNLFLAAAAAIVCASAANASITVGSITPGTDPYTGPTPTYTFDPGSQPAISGGQFVAPPSVPGVHAVPYGSTGDYYAVGTSDGSPGTITLPNPSGIYALSFLWGSVDAYNTLEFMSGSNVLATFTGSIIHPANGDQSNPATNPVVEFLLTGTDATSLTGLRLTSSQNAFEIDNLAINPVPEPATWAMMLLGFGGIGLAVRRRRDRAIAQVA